MESAGDIALVLLRNKGHGIMYIQVYRFISTLKNNIENRCYFFTNRRVMSEFLMHKKLMFRCPLAKRK